MPLRYRQDGYPNWHSGITENLSCSGVLFRGYHSLDRFTGVEVVLQLPRQLSGDVAMNLYCRGYIVRTLEPRFLLARHGLAVAFLEYRLLGNEERPAGQMRQAQLELPRAQMTPDTVHQLNDLLAIVLGNSELILSHPALPPDVRESLIRIQEAGERAAALLREPGSGGRG
jgi:signal transduction histidine kinase